THRNLISNIVATSEILPLTPADVGLSFLPLSHVLQRHVDYASLYVGATIAHCGDVTSVPGDMVAVRPTFAAGVPRFFEKVYARIAWEVAQSPRIQRSMFAKAMQLGRDHLLTGKASLWYRTAERLVFSKIRRRLGGRIRLFISGGAALTKELA